jgi:putative oxidoreductase
MIPAAFSATAAGTALIVGARNRRLRKAKEGEQDPLFEEEYME